MGQINEEIKVTDNFSNQLGKFCSLIEKSATAFSDAKEKMLDFVTKPLKGLRALGDAWNNLKDKANEFADSRGVKALEDETRFRAIYGDLIGSSAVNQYRQNANELGVDAGGYVKSALSMNRAGFGSQDVTEWGKLADKMALITGQSFEEVFSGLASDATSHSVSNMTGLLGGSQGAERMLKRAGVERMLNRGDLDGAAKTFEKIAEQLGYCDDAASIMSDTITNQIQKTINKIENKIKSVQLFMTKAIKPAFDAVMRTVNKIAESKLFNSAFEGLKEYISYIAKGFEIAASAIEYAVSAVVDFMDRNSEVFEFIGDLIVKIFIVISVIKGVQLAVAGVTLAVNVAKNAVMLLNGAIGFIPILIIGAIIGITKAFQKFWENTTGESINFIQGIIGGFFHFSGTIIGAFNLIIDTIANKLEDAKAFIINTVNDLGLPIIMVFNKIKDAIFEKIQSVVGFIMDKVASLMDLLGQTDAAAKVLEAKTAVNSAIEDKKVSWEAGETYVAKHREVKSVSDFANEYAKQGVILGGEITNAFEDKFGGVFKGFGDVLGDIGRDTHLIKGMMTDAQEVAWLKELSERQYINRLNVQSPNIVQNVHLVNNHPSNNKDLLREIEKSLIEQQEVNGFGVRGA